MSLPDTVNGLYEFIGGFFLWWNVWRLLQDQKVRGVSILSTAFFSSWSLWNLLFYSHLQQWASFYGGLNILAANLTWVSLMWWYRDGKAKADLYTRE